MNEKASLTETMFQIRRQQIQQQREQAEQRQLNEQKILRDEQLENETMLKVALQAYPKLQDDSGNIHVMSLPSAPKQLSPPSPQRIANYQRHLRSTIAEAATHSHADEVPFDCDHNLIDNIRKDEEMFAANRELPVIADKLCMTCKGACCVAGKDHAYVSVHSIRKYMDSNPNMSEEEVFDSFYALRPAITIEGGCINQGEFGCGLPREMRSLTCNGFYCEHVTGYLDAVEQYQGKAKKALAVQRTYTLDRFADNADTKIVAVHLLDAKQDQKLEIKIDTEA